MKIQKLYLKYPYETYGEQCFRRLCWRFRIKKHYYWYDECYSVSMKAYMYTICHCSMKEDSEKLIIAYLYKMMKVYIICVLNSFYESKNICILNNLKAIDVEDYRV